MTYLAIGAAMLPHREDTLSFVSALAGVSIVHVSSPSRAFT
jgi:hypothetical protein